MSTSKGYTTPRKDLDVLSKYRELLTASLGADSVYIRTKETYEALAASGDLKDADKAKVLAETLSSMNGSLANSCMQTALQWASAEKDIEFKKLETSKQLELLDADIALKKSQKNKTDYESVATQAETLRVMGKPNVTEGRVTGLVDEGKIFGDMSLTTAQAGKVNAETTLAGSKLNESYAIIHKTVADTIVNYGYWRYSLDEKGIVASPDDTPSRGTVEGVKPLSDLQRIIAREQAKGYTYNAWANGVTASAGMVGTGMAGGVDMAGPLGEFTAGLTSLRGVELPTDL